MQCSTEIGSNGFFGSNCTVGDNTVTEPLQNCSSATIVITTTEIQHNRRQKLELNILVLLLKIPR